MYRSTTNRFVWTQLAIAAVLTLALVASACGDTPRADQSSTSAPSTAPPATTVPASTSDTPPTTVPSTTTSPVTSSPPDAGDGCAADPTGSIHHHTAFFAWCGPQGERPPFPVIRKMENAPDLQAKLELLVRGTKGYEQDRGLHTGFDWVEERTDIEVIASVDADGVATIDFRLGDERWNPGSRASTSHQLLEFLEPFEATVFSDPAVKAIDRSTLCWGELGCVGITTRAEWRGALFVNYGLMCDPEFAPSSSGCFVGGNAVPIYRATVVGVADDDILNMRAGPGVEFFKVGALAPGTEADVVDRGRHSSDGGFWQVVRNAEGDVGWVNAAFLADSATLGDRSPQEQLADTFVRFAARPSDATFADLPLADTVALGLGSEIVKEVRRAVLRSPGAWSLDVADFRAYVGPFSALDMLVHADPYQVTVGEHDHCAAPPVPVPDGFEDHVQISLQPRDGTYDSCLMWSTVDFFVNEAGEVDAITMDMWEP